MKVTKAGLTATAMLTGLTAGLYPSAASADPSSQAPGTLGMTTACGGTELNMANVASLAEFNQSLPEEFRGLANNRTVATAIKNHYRWVDASCIPGHISADSGLGQPSTPTQPSSGAQPATQGPAAQYFNWAGYSNDDPSQYISEADGQWAIPHVTGEGYSSIWPGIGNPDQGSPDSIVQAGTEQDINGSETDYLWFEIFPQENQERLLYPVPHPGDNANITVEYSPSSHTANFVLCDETQAICIDPMTQTVQAQHPVGTGAEWIVERTEVNGQYPYLANFGRITIAGAYENYKGGYLPISSTQNYYKINMIDCQTHEAMANTSALGGDGASFYVQWLNYGNYRTVPCQS